MTTRARRPTAVLPAAPGAEAARELVQFRARRVRPGKPPSPATGVWEARLLKAAQPVTVEPRRSVAVEWPVVERPVAAELAVVAERPVAAERPVVAAAVELQGVVEPAVAVGRPVAVELATPAGRRLRRPRRLSRATSP